MAKAKRKSSVNRFSVNSEQEKNHSKWIFLTAVTLVFVLLILLFSMSSLNKVIDEQKTPTETTVTDTTELLDGELGEEDQDLLGMAIGGFVEGNPDVVVNILPKMAVINPTTATAYIDSDNGQGHPFTIQVEAYPNDNTITVSEALKKLNHFKITLDYPVSSFEFVTAKVFSDVGETKMAGNWETTINDNDVNGIVIFEGQGNDPTSVFPYDQKVILAEFIFKPLKNVGMGIITLSNIEMVNSLDDGEEADIILVDPTNDEIEVNFNLKVYRDIDGDEFGRGGSIFTSGNDIPVGYIGNNQDCVDDKANDPIVDGYTCPINTAGCSYIAPDLIDLNADNLNLNAYYSSECAICQNPIGTEICDGIDNDCKNGIDDGNGAPPSCLDEGYDCGVFYLCKGGQMLDCNNEQYADELKLDGHDRCALNFPGSEFCDVSTGECVGDLSDCTDVQAQLTECQADLGVCEGNLVDCYNNNPNCDAVECTALGGQCTSNGDCLVEDGTGCTVNGGIL